MSFKDYITEGKSPFQKGDQVKDKESGQMVTIFNVFQSGKRYNGIKAGKYDGGWGYVVELPNKQLISRELPDLEKM